MQEIYVRGPVHELSRCKEEVLMTSSGGQNCKTNPRRAKERTGHYYNGTGNDGGQCTGYSS
jgi:hypothetical protein